MDPRKKDRFEDLYREAMIRSLAKVGWVYDSGLNACDLRFPAVGLSFRISRSGLMS